MGTRRNIVVGANVADWIASVNKHCGPYPGAQGIGVEQDGQLLGGLAFCDYRGVSIQIHCASIGSRNWVTRKWLHDIFDYAFRQLGVKKIFGIISSGNAKVLKFGLDMGFAIECPIKDIFPDGDALVVYMTPEMCRWIDYERFPYEQAQLEAA